MKYFTCSNIEHYQKKIIPDTAKKNVCFVILKTRVILEMKFVKNISIISM